MKIKNKIESYKKIVELKLNRFPEKIFTQRQTSEIAEFMKNFPAKYYAIRDKSKSGGVFKLKVEPNDVINEVSGYDLFSINVSSYNYIENQLLVGEICITPISVSAILSTNSHYSVRDAIRNPEFNFVTTIHDNRLLNKIPCFDKVYKYIADNDIDLK